MPEQEAAEFLDERNTVVGGLPSDRRASGVAKRLWSNFKEKHPNLSTVVQSLPGKSARKPYAQEEGGRRVAQGLVREGEQVKEEPANASAPKNQKAESVASEKTQTHTATSIWYSVDEDGNFKDEVEAETKEEVKEEEADYDPSSRSSSSVAASSIARAVRDLDLRSAAGREKANEEEEEDDQRSNWSSEWSQSSSWSGASSSNWSGSRGWEERAWAGRRWREQGSYHCNWRGGQHR